MLINSGVKEIKYAGDYPDSLAIKMLDESKIKISKYVPSETQNEFYKKTIDFLKK